MPLIVQGLGVPRGRRVGRRFAGRRLPDHPRGRRRAADRSRALAAGPLASAPRPRRGPRAHRVQRVSRRRLDHRHLHGALRPPKYVHYQDYRPQLYDLEADPGETRDLACEGGHEAAIAEGQRRLQAICDPAEVTARAFADQERLVAELGGAEVVRQMGKLPYTPAPGEATADFALEAVPLLATGPIQPRCRGQHVGRGRMQKFPGGTGAQDLGRLSRRPPICPRVAQLPCRCFLKVVGAPGLEPWTR